MQVVSMTGRPSRIQGSHYISGILYPVAGFMAWSCAASISHNVLCARSKYCSCIFPLSSSARLALLNRSFTTYFSCTHQSVGNTKLGAFSSIRPLVPWHPYQGMRVHIWLVARKRPSEHSGDGPSAYREPGSMASQPAASANEHRDLIHLDAAGHAQP